LQHSSRRNAVAGCFTTKCAWRRNTTGGLAWAHPHHPNVAPSQWMLRPPSE
jgi:hypothetical protein